MHNEPEMKYLIQLFFGLFKDENINSTTYLLCFKKINPQTSVNFQGYARSKVIKQSIA